MEYTIREATAEDYDTLLHVFDQGDAYHRRALPHIFCQPDGPSRSRAYINDLLSDEDATILVAECAGQIVGEVSIALRETRDIPILVPRRYAAIDTLIVIEAFRRAGVGRALMEGAHRWALDRGVAEIELTVWDFNEDAIAFYEHLGYKPTRHTMSITLHESRDTERGNDMTDTGILVYKPEKCYHGYTLYCHTYEDPRQSESGMGHIYLIDMQGQVVHEWTTHTAQQSFCRLLPNGDLIYPTRDRSRLEQAGIRKLDRDSNVLWHYHCRIDHDFQVLENGNLLLHTIADSMVPALGRGLKRNPYFVEVTPEFDLVWSWRGEEHVGELRFLLSTAAWEHFQERIHGPFVFDWAHNNTCQVIPPNATAEKEAASGGPVRFKPGNIVFSYRSVDIIGVIDRDTGLIVWAWGPGEIDGQHKPHLLPNGNILIYDNGTLRGYSRVIELNPLTEEVEWEYTAKPKETFLSKYISGAQRLPNGNTLICEGANCHLFEVTPGGEVVWDYISPLQEPGAMAIYRCLCYSPEYVRPLLGNGTALL